MDTFEYEIVEKLVVNNDDLVLFTELITGYLNAGWVFASPLIVKEDGGVVRTYIQALIRITHVKGD